MTKLLSNHKKRGFTLIELLVVIALIGILSTIMVRSINAAKQKANDAKRIQDLKSLKLAIDTYFSTCYIYPTALADLSATSCNGGNNAPLMKALLQIPVDPKSKASYAYYSQTSPTVRYHICGTLDATYASTSSTPGRAGIAPLAGGDTCNGTTIQTYDLSN